MLVNVNEAKPIDDHTIECGEGKASHEELWAHSRQLLLSFHQVQKPPWHPFCAATGKMNAN
jgi:hypothetical protein